MKKRTLLYILMIVYTSVYADMPEEFKNFPKGSEPEFIASKIIQLYNNAAESTTPIRYPETCSWFGSLRFAGATKDDEMLRLLENRFIPLLGENSGAMQTPNHVDNTVFGIVPLQLYIQTRKQAYYDVGIDFADRQWTMPANPSSENRVKYQALLDKGLSWQTRYWIDDMFMITAIQTQAYLASNDEKYINRAAHEMTAYLDSLQRPNGLFYHFPQAPFFWGRGNGWMAVGMADLLTYLPENNSDRPKILQEYLTMMATLKSYQNEEGLWNQLIDDPDAWTETSGSAMFTYAMITGVKNGWLDASEYAPVVRKAWLALTTYLTDSFQLREVCEGTNIGYTKEYYLERRRITGDRHGQAALLWCAIALYETERNSLAALKSLSFDYGILKPAFNPETTEYTCYLPAGISKVIPRVETLYRNTAVFEEVVNVSSGSSTIVVTSADESAAKIYHISFETGNDVNCTNLIINNDFDLAPDANCAPVPIASGIDGWDFSGIPAWRLSKSSCSAKQFYGWTHNQSLLGTSTSQGINTDGENKHGDWVAWIGGNKSAYTEFEFSQTINKDHLDAGTYKVQCLLAVGKDNRRNNQRFFVNNRVQYFGNQHHYTDNLVEGEDYTFAGYSEFSDTNLQEMVIYTTINDTELLTIGIRTSNKKGDGTIVSQQSPMFKVDYFRLTKIDPVHASDANLSGITLSIGSLDFSPETTDYTITLPEGTRVVTASATADIQDAKIIGTGMVDVSSGSGVSIITVTALDGITTRTYTVNYNVDSNNSIDIHETPAKVTWFVADRRLIVKGVDAYTVYNINGVKIADVKNVVDTAVTLKQGVYIVRTGKNTEAFKIIVK